MNLKKIRIIKLKIVNNNKGDILKYISIKMKGIKKFEEIYFSEIKKRNIKGWNLHTKSYCHLAVPYGKVKFVFMSRDKKGKKTVILSKKNYKLVILPPNIWFSFESLQKISIVANYVNKVHAPEETLKNPIH